MRVWGMILAVGLLATTAQAQDNSAADEDALDDLMGQWHFQACQDAGGAECTTVERTYEPAADGDLAYYTETVDGETREGFVGYDEETGSYVEYDYPEGWDRSQFERAYSGEAAAADLYGDDYFDTESSVARWRMNETGETMALRTPMGDIEGDNPVEVMGVIFSRVPIIGSDPIIGGE